MNDARLSLEGRSEEFNEEYDDEFKAELDKRIADYKSGKAQMVSAGESKMRIEAILKKKDF